MKGDLRNIPNMPDWSIAIDPNGRDEAARDYIHDEVSGILYRVRMCYAIHDTCGFRLKALVDRTQYNRADREGLIPWLVYCPRCFVRVGKKGRKRLQAQGRLVAFQDVRNLSSLQIRKNFVEACYLFPLGIYLDENGQIGEVSKNQVEVVEEEERPGSRPGSSGRYRRTFRSPCAEQVLGIATGRAGSELTNPAEERAVARGFEQEQAVERDFPEPEWAEPREPPEDDF